MNAYLTRALHSDHRLTNKPKPCARKRRGWLPYLFVAFFVMALISQACAIYIERNPEMSIAGLSVAQVAKECK